MSKLQDFLKANMPKQPDLTPSNARMIAFQQQPIRRYAQSFSASLPELPKDAEEMAALLWVFGENIAGEMERRMNHALRVADDAIKLMPSPLMYKQTDRELREEERDIAAEQMWKERQREHYGTY